VAQQAEQLEQANAQLQQKIHIDSLTGVFNRGRFDEAVQQAFGQAGPEQPLTILFLDIDNFKQFNDIHGHAAGDQVLIAFARRVGEVIGERGEVFRYGGEEFVVICRGVGQKDGAVLAEDVCETIAQSSLFTTSSEQNLTVTTSVGMSCYAGETFKNVKQLIKAADQAVYAAKNAGRNGVRVFVPRGASKDGDPIAA